jgi:hypothetical protein
VYGFTIKQITFLKTIPMPVIQSGVLKNDPFRELKLRQKPVPKGFLTLLAYSDLRQLNKHNI